MYKGNENKIVRIFHPIVAKELDDIARGLNVPLQKVFSHFITTVYREYDMDLILVKVVAECEKDIEDDKEITLDDLPF